MMKVSSCSLSCAKLAHDLAQGGLILAMALWDILPFREAN
jgi:hypothetical protein